jgi:hypothetical protein
MGIFDFLRSADPTRDWLPDPKRALDFDFDLFELCGAGLGDRVDALSFLGRAEDARTARRGWLRYYSRGLEIETADELIRSFVLHWSWPNEYGAAFASFAGACLHRGEPCRLHRETNFLDFTLKFEEPDQRVRDDAGWVFLYEYAGVDMRVEFDDLDLLCAVAIVKVR